MATSAILLALSLAAAPAETVIENQVPVVSPDGSRIAFLSNRDGQDDLWFPDGKRLAFQSNRSGRMEVWTD